MDREHARPEHRGIRARLGLGDLQVLGGERHRARVDDLAHPGDEVLARLGERPADHDDRRVDEAHARGEHLADVAARLSHRLDRVDVAALDELHDILARLGAQLDLLERAAERRAGGQRLEAPAVAALARHVGTARDVDVADVARRALGAALQVPARDDAGADAGRDLHEHQVVDVGPGELPLAERHDVDVVVDQHRHVEAVAEPAGHVEAVPAGHDRRVDRATASSTRRGPAGRCRSPAGRWARARASRAARGRRSRPSPAPLPDRR